MSISTIALLSLFPAALSGMLNGLRRRARPLVAAGTACAFLSLTVSGCGHSNVSGALPAIHYHQDHLGGVALQTGENGELVTELSNGPWGERLQGSTEPYGFTGEEWEEEAGLYDFGARLYDPAIGRFLSPDPASIENPEVGIGDPQDLNPYAYVRNAPTGHVDPDGRLGHIAIGAIAGGLIAASVYIAKNAGSSSFSMQTLGAVAAGGAVAGALAAATLGASLVVTAAAGGTMTATTMVGTAAGGALAGMSGGITERAIATGSLSATMDPPAGARDAVSGVSGLAGGMVVGRIVQIATPVVKAGIARAQGALKNASALKSMLQRVDTLDFSTPRNGAVFYSGPGQGTRATIFAERTGGMTIEMTPGGRSLASDPLFQALSVSPRRAPCAPQRRASAQSAMEPSPFKRSSQFPTARSSAA